MAVQLPSPNGFLHLISPISSQLHKKRFPGTFAMERLMVVWVKGKTHNPPATLRRPPKLRRGSARGARGEQRGSGAAPPPPRSGRSLKRRVTLHKSRPLRTPRGRSSGDGRMDGRIDEQKRQTRVRTGGGLAPRAFPRRPAGRRPRSGGKEGGDGVGPPAAWPPLPALSAPSVRLGRSPTSPRAGVRQKRGTPTPRLLRCPPALTWKCSWKRMGSIWAMAGGELPGAGARGRGGQ